MLVLTLPLLFMAPFHTKAQTFTDTTVFLFSDPNYKCSLHIFDTTATNEEINNAIITFVKNGKTIFTDSIFCMRSFLEYKDFNKDGVKDILAFNTSSARSNWTHYLYLASKKSMSFVKVKGFEKICNPEFNTNAGVITSYTLAGKSYYSFYRINAKKQVVDLNRSFNAELDKSDEIRFNKIIASLKQKKR